MDSKVTMFAVGQGAMNLIEIYDVIDEERVLVNLSLIDCGSIDGHQVSKAACEAALAYTVEKMKERARVCGEDNIRLDNLLITHRDRDHWNLLDRLFRMAIGVETALISENIGYFRVEGTYDYIENYYVNRIERIWRYERNYYADCEIEFTFSYIMEEQELITKVTLEYEYEDNSIAVYWSPTYLNVAVSDGEMWLNRMPCISSSGEYHIFTQKGWVSGEIPSDYEDFIQLFTGIYEEIKETILDIPDAHNEVFGNILQISEISQEDIEGATIQNRDQVYPFIQNVYIGGYASLYRNRFSDAEKLLKMLSPNVVSDMSVGSSIFLYKNKDEDKGFRLYILEHMLVGSLKKVNNAEPITKRSIKNNATSIVSVLLLDEAPEFEKIVFTGDATVHTFYQMLLDNSDQDKYQNAVWTAPHHGGYTTIHGEIPNDEEEREVFPVLLELAQPTGMIISAGVENAHGHPCWGFICTAAEALQDTQTTKHNIYCNTNNCNKRYGAKWDFISAKISLYTTYTKFDDGSAGYKDYDFSFTQENAVLAAKMPLTENQRKPERGIFGNTKIPIEAEIPPKSMFFHRG